MLTANKLSGRSFEKASLQKQRLLAIGLLRGQ